MVERLCSCLSETTYSARNLLAVPIVRELASSTPVRALAEAVLGKTCFAVKGTFFNKTQEANWKVVWHQDLTIVVREGCEVPGFDPWTIKAGINHVQPPALLHASSACVAAKPRRVIYLEFAATALPDGLEWYDKV